MWVRVPEADPMKEGELFINYYEDVGEDELFQNTEVDKTTRLALMNYFRFHELVTHRRMFQVFWENALNKYYPMYRDEIEMWKDRKMREWFFDVEKQDRKEHEGTFHLSEDVVSHVVEELRRRIDTTGNGQRDFSGKTDTESDRSGNVHIMGDESYTDTSNEKNRNFSFRNPESNYTGGVIPYDLDDNPSVEFISTQADAVGRRTSEHTGENTSDSTERYNDTASETRKDVDKTTTEEHADTTEDRGTGSEGTKNQDSVEHWIETIDREADNINKLAQDLIEQIPKTDFWNQFARRLRSVFRTSFTPSQIGGAYIESK